jgi:hypothetical protein
MYRKKNKSRERQVADKLVKQQETNEKLKEKTISNTFWKLFSK